MKKTTQYWGVSTKFFDSGKVKTNIFPVEAAAKPESTMERMFRDGCYDGFLYQEAETTAGYAFFFRLPDCFFSRGFSGSETAVAPITAAMASSRVFLRLRLGFGVDTSSSPDAAGVSSAAGLAALLLLR